MPLKMYLYSVIAAAGLLSLTQAETDPRVQVALTLDTPGNGVSTTPSGRLFVLYARVDGTQAQGLPEVVEWINDTGVPFPNAAWNSYAGNTSDPDHPRIWKVFITITLRKPGKPDYTIPKAYRPIALEETMAKVLESIFARRLASYAEREHMLPANHFGGRPGRTTTDATLFLVQRIKNAWRRGRVVSVVFMDIAQAFPSVNHERLLHNLRKRGVPGNLVNWVSSFLTDRFTHLKFDDFTSALLSASMGIPQGSPLSPILYLFYSSDLLEILDPAARDRFVAGYIDDTMLAVESGTIRENIEKLSAIMPLAFNWSRTHACSFDLGKFQLVHYTRNRNKYEALALVTPTHTIPVSESAKYLGLIMDRQLRWKEQVEQAIKKGTKAVMAINRLTRPTFGLPHQFVRQLYRSVVVPKMEYGLCVWYSPVYSTGAKRRKGSVGFLTRLGKVQNLACRLITGAFRTFRTTPVDALNYLAHIPPVALRLNHASFNAAAHLASLPPHHPLQPMVRRCINMCPLHHRSVLHDMFAAFPEITGLETVDPTPLDTMWTAPLTYRIAANKDEAEEELSRYTDGVCVYGDGSGFEGGVGGAAVMKTKDGEVESRRVYLGTMEEHTVFEAELIGLILGLDLIRSVPRLCSATILIDNQAAIRAVARPRPQPGQYLVRLFHRTLDALRRQRRTLKLCIPWVPGHQDIEGNEAADEEAKRAAQGDSSALSKPLLPLHDLPISVAALKAARKKLVARQRGAEWETSRVGKRIAQVDKTPPGKSTLKWYADLPRRQCSILTQLRTGHIGLNAYLARFGIVDTSHCPTCNEPETVNHFLFTCRRFGQQRDVLRRALHAANHQQLSKRSLLGKSKNRTLLLDYVAATGRFPQYAPSPS
jgi:ribonuclease HI